MASRRETEQRRASLRDDLRAACRNGTLAPGEIVPSVRDLADRYEISVKVVRQALEQLVGEGVLYTIERQGTFAGQQTRHASEFFLLLLPYLPQPGDQADYLQAGFEERIAQLGGACLALRLEKALEYRDKGEMPPLAGIFDYAYEPLRPRNWGSDPSLPHVGFASWLEDHAHSDAVSFDDLDGGRQAAQYLLGLGHRQIAFLALHGAEGDPGKYLWSAEREAGWQQALRGAGVSAEGLAYHPVLEPEFNAPGQTRAARRIARALIGRPDITAVVAANDSAAWGLFSALRAAQIPRERWPAVVGFDSAPSAEGFVLTSFRLPWDELGRAAADLLWERRQGRLTGPPQHRRIPMRLVPRLTSQAGWSLMAGASALTAAES